MHEQHNDQTRIDVHVHHSVHVMRHNELELKALEFEALLHELQTPWQLLLQHPPLILPASQLQNIRSAACTEGHADVSANHFIYSVP